MMNSCNCKQVICDIKRNVQMIQSADFCYWKSTAILYKVGVSPFSLFHLA